MKSNTERVTITVSSQEELRGLNVAGKKTNERLQKRLQLGLPVNISLSKNRILDRLVGLRNVISDMSSRDAEGGREKSVH